MENFFLYPIQWNIAVETPFQQKNKEEHYRTRTNSKKEMKKGIQSKLKNIIIIEPDTSTNHPKKDKKSIKSSKITS